MNHSRRRVLSLAAGAAAASVTAHAAFAQSFPTRPVHIIVGFAAGGPNDTIARLIGQWLSERLGQQIVVENHTGAGGTIATGEVAHAAADGYALLLLTAADTVNATLYQKSSFDFARDIAPVAAIARVPNVLVVNPAVPARTVGELVAYAKANPGKINMATAGIGSTPHMSGELFKQMAGVDLVDVAYRGGAPALIDLIAGQVQVMFEPTVSTVGYVRAGKLRALAVTSASRSDLLPDIPTVGESVPGYEVSQWYGIGAPRNTPAAILARLNQEINAALADPKLTARLADLGATTTPMTIAEFAKLVADETGKWAKVIRAANIKVE